MQAILQTGSQLHAHRLRLYLSSPSLQAFPQRKGFCNSAEELGTRDTDHKGPCLVLLTNCKVSAADLNHHIRSTFLRGYIVRVYWFEHTALVKSHCVSHLQTLLNGWKPLVVVPQLWPGKTILEAPAAAIASLGVQAAANNETSAYTNYENRADIFSETLAITEVTTVESVVKVRLQTYPRELEDTLIDELTEVECRPHGFSHCLYAVHVDGIYRYGVGSGSDMFLAPPDRVNLAKDSISRASLKLEEALQVRGFDLHLEMIAMDIGAAPGAWTQYLSRYVKRVAAVDPAPLHKRVSQPNVTHIKKMAQDSTKEILACSEGKGFDLLVCDINRHPVEAAQVVLPFLKYLRKDGLLLLTLKFHGRGRDKELKVDEMKALFKEPLKDMDCIALLANSAYERTFVGSRI